MSDATIEIDGDLSRFRNQFTLANQFAERQLKDMAESAKKHTGAATAHASSSFAAMRGVAERSASLMGGAFGDLSDIVFDLGERATSAGGAIGGLGVTAGAAVVGVAALGFAALQLAGYADEAAQRLEEAGLAALIPRDAQDSLDKYREGTKGLRDEVDLLTVSMSGDLLDAVGNLSLALTGALDKMGRLRDAAAEKIGGGAEDGSMFRRVLLAVGTGLGSEVAGLVSGAIETQIADGERLNKIRADEAALIKDGTAYMQREAAARNTVTEAVVDGLSATEKLSEARRKQVEADRAAEEAQRDAAAQFIADLKEQGKEWKALGDEIKTAADKREEWASAMAGVAELGPATAPLANVDTAGIGGPMGLKGSAALGVGKGLLAGGSSGAMGALGSAGPVGWVIAAIVALPDVIDKLADVVGGITDMFETLPERMSVALGETLPDMIAGVGDMIGAIVQAAFDLPNVIMDALPEIVSQITQLVPNLIGDLIDRFSEEFGELFADGIHTLFGGGVTDAIVKGLWDGVNDAFNDFPEKIAKAIGEWLSKVATPFKDKQGDVLGTNLTAEGGRRLFGVDLPSFDRGTSEITRTGLARVHRGEEISRKGEGRSRSGGMAPVINVYGPDTRELVRQIRELLGGDHGAGYGLGDTLP